MLTALGVVPLFPAIFQAGSMLVGTLDLAAVLEEPSLRVYWTVVLAV